MNRDEALARTLVAVSHMAAHLEDEVSELDINPLLLLPGGEGAVAVDALVALKGARA